MVWRLVGAILGLVLISCLGAVAYKDFVLRDLGCWRDTVNRAIPSIDHLIGGSYKARPDAIQACAHAARILGFSIFAVQDGGWCAAGPNAIRTYKKFGPSQQCASNGKGGPWANQAYEIDTVYIVTYKSVGCFMDKPNRAIPAIEKRFVDFHDNYKTRADAIGKCARASAALSDSVFAVQDGGWCASTNNLRTYNKYGYAQNCRQGGKGGPWSNAVYEITFVTKVNLTRIGCYGDKEDRAMVYLRVPEVLSESYKQRPHAIEQCVRYASPFGYPYVGIQDGGACMAGNTFGRYGASKACKLDSKGGPWASEVFLLSSQIIHDGPSILPTHKHYYLNNLGCWADKPLRAIPRFLDGTGVLVGHHISRSDAMQKCAQVAASRGYDVIGVQYDGQCFSGPNARKSFRKYGPSAACNKNGKGGTWANQVYEINTISNPTFTGLGCYKDNPRSRAISGLEGAQPCISGDYKQRPDAVRKCAMAAAGFGYKIFGIQNGGACVSSANAQSRYSLYGLANTCGDLGRGGLLTNSVYEIIKNFDFYIEDRGCWSDSSFRTIPTVEGMAPELLMQPDYQRREDAIAKCARFAFSRGFNFFALQNGGWCATSDKAAWTYRLLGPSQKCLSHGKGGQWANQVYEIFRQRPRVHK